MIEIENVTKGDRLWLWDRSFRSGRARTTVRRVFVDDVDESRAVVSVKRQSKDRTVWNCGTVFLFASRAAAKAAFETPISALADLEGGEG